MNTQPLTPKAPRPTRIEITGNIIVHQPSWPTYEPPPLWYVRPLGDRFGSAAA